VPFNPSHTAASIAGMLAEVSTFPADGEYVAYDDHPLEGGAEVPEIPRIPVADVTWVADPGGEPKIVTNMDWGLVTGPCAAEHWAVHDADDTLRFYELFLDSRLAVTAAGPVDTDVEMYYPDEDQEY
jgi:hypothetical protein